MTPDEALKLPAEQWLILVEEQGKKKRIALLYGHNEEGTLLAVNVLRDPSDPNRGSMEVHSCGDLQKLMLKVPGETLVHTMGGGKGRE